MIVGIFMTASIAWSPDRTIFTGQDLLDACSDRSGLGLATCKGYLDATISTTMMFRGVSYKEHQTPERLQKDFLCPPGNALRLSDEVAAVAIYIANNPDAKSMHAPLAIVNGLQAAYGCK